MIIDHISNAACYTGLSAHFAAAFRFLQETDLNKLEPGRVEIDGQNVFATLRTAELTAAPEVWEAHKDYADIHVLVDGSEAIGYYPITRMDHELAFQKNADCALEKDLDGWMYELRPGEFMLVLPQDIHKPNCPVGEKRMSKKLIMKVRVTD